MESDRRICVGMIAGAHGVRGLVRLRSFMEDPEDIADYEPLTDETGETPFIVTLKSAAKDFFIAEIKGVETRERAEALRGLKLYIARDLLPKIGKRAFYEADLIGLMAKDKEGREHGTILAVHNYGAGSFLEIGIKKNAGFMLPFTDACVPIINISEATIIIDPPEGWLDQNKPPQKQKAEKMERANKDA